MKQCNITYFCTIFHAIICLLFHLLFECNNFVIKDIYHNHGLEKLELKLKYLILLLLCFVGSVFLLENKNVG